MKKIEYKNLIITILTSIFVVYLLFKIVFPEGFTKEKVKAETLEVKALKLVNDKGETCGFLCADEDGGARFSLGGREFDGPQFSVRVDTSKEKVQGGHTVVNVQGRRGYMRLTDDYSDAGPLIYMVNAQGKLAFAAGLWGEKGEGYIRIDDYDPTVEGVYADRNVMDKLEKKSFMVVGKKGKVLWSAPNENKQTTKIDTGYYPTGEKREEVTNLGNGYYRLQVWSQNGKQIADGKCKYTDSKMKDGTFWLFEYKTTVIGTYSKGKLLSAYDIEGQPVDLSKLEKKTEKELMDEGLLSKFNVEIN